MAPDAAYVKEKKRISQYTGILYHYYLCHCELLSTRDLLASRPQCASGQKWHFEENVEFLSDTL